MTKDYRRLTEEATQGVLLDDPAFLREIVESKLQEFLEAEMTEHVGAAPYELTTERKGAPQRPQDAHPRTRVGTLNLLVPQDREGTFSTRKVKSVTERLCRTSFSKSPVSSLADRLDSEL
jgi:putative transposase